jgi:hypothetical protein
VDTLWIHNKNARGKMERNMMINRYRSIDIDGARDMDL